MKLYDRDYKTLLPAEYDEWQLIREKEIAGENRPLEFTLIQGVVWVQLDVTEWRTGVVDGADVEEGNLEIIRTNAAHDGA